MTVLAYGKGSYRRLAAGLPELRLINMYVEAAATSQDKVVLLSRPGMVADQTIGDGPIRGLHQRDGVIDGQLFTVSGSTLYGNGALGSVPGVEPVRMASSASQLLVASGAGLVATNGSSLSAVAFPDGADVASVVFVGGQFVAIRAGTKRFYWSAILDGTTWDPLDYASAESSPDPLLDAVVVGDVLWLLGAATIEPWSLTGAAELPFSRIEGRNLNRGVLATGCAVELDNTVFFVGDDRRAYRIANVPQGISDPGIEERISRSQSVSAFVIEHDGHKLFCIRLDTETMCYDVSTGEWCEFASYGYDNWRVAVSASLGGRSLLGDDRSGTIWRFDNDAFADGTAPLSRLFTAFQAISDGAFTLDVLTLDAEFGATPLQLGQGSEPIIEVRSSRDGGKTWSGWRQATLGRQGEYRHQSAWRRFGSFDSPGALFEYRTTDPVRLRISAVRANEATGGRSR